MFLYKFHQFIKQANAKTAIEEAISALKTALDGTDVNVIKEKSEALMQASLKLGEAMYKAQGAADASAAGTAGAESGAQSSNANNSGDDKVVDADYEEVK